MVERKVQTGSFEIILNSQQKNQRKASFSLPRFFTRDVLSPSIWNFKRNLREVTLHSLRFQIVWAEFVSVAEVSKVPNKDLVGILSLCDIWEKIMNDDNRPWLAYLTTMFICNICVIWGLRTTSRDLLLEKWFVTHCFPMHAAYQSPVVQSRKGSYLTAGPGRCTAFFHPLL